MRERAVAPARGPRIGIGLAVLLSPSAALAAEGFEWRIHGFYILDFLLLVALLYWGLKKPLAQYLTERRATILRAIEEAQALRVAAESRLAEYERRLRELDTERERILAEFVQDGERERTRILAEAQRAADKLVSDAERRITQESRKLSKALEREAVDLAVTMAENALRQRMDATTQQRLVSEAIQAIEGDETRRLLARS